MSIFDTIRFSNPDIYDEDEMSKLPRDLLYQWAVEGGFDTHSIKMSKDTNRSIYAIVAKLLVFEQTKNHTRYSCGETSAIIEKIFKKYHTARLKKLIADYN